METHRRSHRAQLRRLGELVSELGLQLVQLLLLLSRLGSQLIRLLSCTARQRRVRQLHDTVGVAQRLAAHADVREAHRTQLRHTRHAHRQ